MIADVERTRGIKGLMTQFRMEMMGVERQINVMGREIGKIARSRNMTKRRMEKAETIN